MIKRCSACSTSAGSKVFESRDSLRWRLANDLRFQDFQLLYLVAVGRACAQIAGKYTVSTQNVLNADKASGYRERRTGNDRIECGSCHI